MCLLSTIHYGGLVSDTRLARSIRIVTRYFCSIPAELPMPSIISLFHDSILRHQDPCLFGFLLIALLSHGKDLWAQEGITRINRIVFVSADSCLTPLPRSLGEDLEMPLLSKPQLTKQATLEALETQGSSESCRQRLTSAWLRVFDRRYYASVTSNKSPRPMLALATIPRLRLEFVDLVRSIPGCGSHCGIKTTNRLDQDMMRLFTKVADYYRDTD
jgi:hypothetical protein